MKNKILTALVEAFSKFPSLGPRQAARIVYHIVDLPPDEQKKIVELLQFLRRSVGRCAVCFYLTEKTAASGLCSICRDNSRDPGGILVVERDADLESIERTCVWKGVYHVLGGVFDPLDKKGGEKITVRELYDRVKKLVRNTPDVEIVFATSATRAGDMTALYCMRILEPLKVRITRLGRGLSSGTELEYIDEQTLKNALENRK